MTAFALIAALLVLIALAWVLPVLLRRRRADAMVAATASNLAVLKDQLSELERDLANAVISEQQYRQARQELERRALEESRGGDAGAGSSALAADATRTAVALGIALPLCAALLYLQLGSPSAISWQGAGGAENVTPQQVEAMITQLSSRLERAPEDGNGWALLARSYFVMQRFPESAAAYERAAALVVDDADLLADYADALAVSQGRRVDDKVYAILQRALKLDPTQWKALAMAGSAAVERKEYGKAIEHWEQLRSRAPAGSEFGRMIEANIAEARELAGNSTAPKGQAASAQAGVGGTVSLSPALAARADPSDTVFVFARAAQGPRQPLAIIRRQVKDLPLRFSLDDTQAMAPQMKLSSYPEVVVSARVSKSAQAMPQSGDLQGASGTVKLGAADVAVVIDKIVP